MATFSRSSPAGQSCRGGGRAAEHPDLSCDLVSELRPETLLVTFDNLASINERPKVPEGKRHADRLISPSLSQVRIPFAEHRLIRMTENSKLEPTVTT